MVFIGFLVICLLQVCTFLIVFYNRRVPCYLRFCMSFAGNIKIIGCMQGGIFSHESHLGRFVTRCMFGANFGCFGKARTYLDILETHGDVFMAMEASMW